MAKIGAKLRELRNKEQMTQKELGEKLNVSAQAISRWENDEVEPSLDTLYQITQFFSIAMDELFGVSASTDKQEKSEETFTNSTVILTLCEQCNDPILKKDHLVRHNLPNGVTKVLCSTCDTKNKIKSLQREKKNQKFDLFIGLALGALFFAALLAITIIGDFPIPFTIIAPILIFALTFCIKLDNNFLVDLWFSITTFGVRMPGLIFTFDLDGFIWLIGMKILFWIIGILISICTFCLATFLGCLFVPFVIPFAIFKYVKTVKELDAKLNACNKKLTSLTK